MSIHSAGAREHVGPRSDNAHGRFESSDRNQSDESPFASEYMSLQKNGNTLATGKSFFASVALQDRGLLPDLQLSDSNSKSGMSFAPHGDRTEQSHSQPASNSERGDLTGNEQKIMQYFMDKGLTRAQAAGIVGNIHQESGGDPNKHQNGGGPGYGLAQWEGSRKRELAQFAREQGKPMSDLQTQLDFMYKELTTTESKAFRALKTATTPAQAADVFHRQYERAGKPNTQNRIAQANRVYRSYGDNPTMMASL